MNDIELDNWKNEWRKGTDPFPSLKRKIARQNLLSVGALVALLFCMALSIVGARHFATAFMYGLVTGLWTTALIVGGYAWWAGRGAWKAVAQTTLAYAELSHRRAVARARTLRFMIIYLIIALVLIMGALALNSGHVSTLSMMAVLGLLIELLVFRYYLQPRRRRQIEEAAQLVQYIRDLTHSEPNQR